MVAIIAYVFAQLFLIQPFTNAAPSPSDTVERVSRSDPGGSPNDERIEVACENKTLSLRCPPGFVIHIISAAFGHTEHGICGSTPSSQQFAPPLNCRAPSSFYNVHERCEGYGVCNVDASVSVFGDPCQGVMKYLSVAHTCIGPLTIQQMTAIITTITEIQQTAAANKIAVAALTEAVKNLETFTQTMHESVVVLQAALVRQLPALTGDIRQIDGKLTEVEQQVLQTNGVAQQLQRDVLKIEEAEAEPEPTPTSKLLQKIVTAG